MEFTQIGDFHELKRDSSITTKSLNDDKMIETTWILNKSLTLEETNKLTQEIKAFCVNMTVNVIDSHHLSVIGLAKDYTNILQVGLLEFTQDSSVYHANTNQVSIPVGWTNKVQNIIGLNNKPMFKPYCHMLTTSRDTQTIPRAIVSLTPLQVATMYSFPSSNGLGSKIAIIELGGGYTTGDLNTYLQSLGITDRPTVINVSINGGTNNPDLSSGSIETVLDLQIVAAICPRATIYMYFAPNTTSGFYNAINAARQTCNIISISWGLYESGWGSTTLTSYNNLFNLAKNAGVNIFCASGDNGSSDGAPGLNVDFPASSPNVIGCGGTTINSSGSVILSEVCWSGSGGGQSAFFSKPSYQTSVSGLTTMRGVPDVCGNANPSSGFRIYMTSYGGNIVVGGTSAVSPLYSGLLGRITNILGSNPGYLNPIFYTNLGIFRDIVSGNNGAFSASSGWDKCTGLGVINGNNLLSVLQTPSNPVLPVASFIATPVSGNRPLLVKFTDQSTNSPVSWIWKYDATMFSTVKNPSFTFNTAGTYSITLTVSNLAGQDTLVRANYITVTQPILPVADFSATPTSGPRRLTVQFTNLLTNATSWNWNFGNFVISRLQNPTITYLNKGTYTVTLTAYNSAGSNKMIKTGYITVS